MQETESIDEYILQHIDPESDYLKALYRDTHVKLLRPRMASGHLQGRMLKMFVKMIRPRQILEIGTYSGYSALCLAEGLSEGGMLHTFEINDEQEDFTRPWLEKSPFADKIRFYIGDALELVPDLGVTFDLAFIDGDKRKYIEYYEMTLAHLSEGGYMIADNTLWDGHVLEQPRNTDAQTIGIKAFNDLVAKDERVVAKQPVPDVVNEAYHVNNFTFGPEYFIPKPVDPRLITEVSIAVARAAMESGVARKNIENWDDYKTHLRELMGQESQLTRQLYDTARRNPQRVVFAEGGHPNMLKAAVEAKSEGICHPIILGNEERIEKLAKELDLSLDGIEIINLRHDREAERRERYAHILSQKRAREGATYEEANDKMFERNYFGMMMVETGDADAFITGLYTKYSNTIKVAKEVIGIRPEYKHFGTMHILNSKKGTYFLADTLINRHPDTSTLIDIAKLADQTVRFFNHTPVISMLSYSNFGSDQAGSPLKVHEAVAYMQQEYPKLAIDGEMQVNFAMNRELRDSKYPFTRLNGKDVNTLVFPNLSSANAGYQLLQAMDPDTEFIGPIQMGLNKPIHFTDIESSVRDIVNITAVAVIDAIVEKKKANK